MTLTRPAWFLLLVRLMGMAFVVVGSAGVVTGMFYAWQYRGNIAAGTMGWWDLSLLFLQYSSGGIVFLASGVYLVKGGRKLVSYCLRDVDDRCHICAYPRKGATGSVCPECGTEWAKLLKPLSEQPADT